MLGKAGPNVTHSDALLEYGRILCCDPDIRSCILATGGPVKIREEAS